MHWKLLHASANNEESNANAASKSELEGEGVHAEGDDEAYRNPDILPSWYYTSQGNQPFPTSPIETLLQSVGMGDGAGSLWAISSGLVRFAVLPSVLLAFLWARTGGFGYDELQFAFGVAASITALLGLLGVAGEASKLLKLLTNVGKRGGGR